MANLKQVIVDAILRVSKDPKYQAINFETADEAREEFTKALISELFPETESVDVPVLEDAMAKMTIEEEKPKKKPGPKPKAKAAADGPVNIEKLNPTQTKKLKALAEELKVDGDKKALLAYLNKLTSEQFDAKKFDDHIRDFLVPVVVEPKPAVEVELVEVEFDGVTYLVDPDTKKVYKENGAVCEHVGDVGLAKFADMEI